MTKRFDQIAAANWSPAVGRPGEIVEGIADIEQCIDIIITTRKGSDPHRPLFGCSAWQWIDRPANVATPNMIREVVDSLELWEPRLELIGVTVQLALAAATLIIEWQPKGSEYTNTTEVVIAA